MKACIVILAILSGLCSCRSARDTAYSQSEMVQITDTTSTQRHINASESSITSVIESADSIIYHITADSIVTRDGGTIHSPILDVKIIQPSRNSTTATDINAEETEQTEQLSELHTDSVATFDDHRQITSGTSLLWLWKLALLAFAAAIVIFIKKNRKKQDH